MSTSLNILIWIFIVIGIITIFVYIASVYILYKAKKKAEKYVGKKAEIIVQKAGELGLKEIKKRYGK